MNMKVIQLAVGWLAQLIEHCTSIAKARKKKKGNVAYTSQYFHCESTCIPLMQIGTTTVFLRLSVFLPCTDVIKCLTEYWTGDIMKRICRSLLKMESTFLPLTIHLISISQRLHDQLRNGIVTLQSNVITKAIFMVYIHTRLLHEQKMQGLVLNV